MIAGMKDIFTVSKLKIRLLPVPVRDAYARDEGLHEVLASGFLDSGIWAEEGDDDIVARDVGVETHLFPLGFFGRVGIQCGREADFVVPGVDGCFHPVHPGSKGGIAVRSYFTVVEKYRRFPPRSGGTAIFALR